PRPAPLSVPRAGRPPHPPILIGGSGEKKTLRLVAKYADACNLFAESPEAVKRKLAILREHCDAVGRNYDEIEKTVIRPIGFGEGSSPAQVVDTLGQFAEAGVQTVLGALLGVEQMTPLEMVGRDVIPQIKDL